MTYSIFHSTRSLQTFLEIFALLSLLAACCFPRFGSDVFRKAERAFQAFACRRRAAIALAALFPMVVRVVLLPLFPIPEPRVHDEFSYLLLADTLAHGRLTNPAPAFWQHFETEYEIVRPTYASQYEPVQGVALAAGQVVARSPWWGVWLSVGLMCGALCWALGFALSPPWALFGSLLAGLQFGIFGFWMNSYFGGAMAAIGGALCFGAIVRRPALSSGAIGALGVLMLLASRPVEGFIWLAAALCMLGRRAESRRVLLTLVPLVAAGMAGLAYYNSQVTGNALEPPYALYRQQYGTPQSYWWQQPVVVEHFNHPELKANYEDQLRYWQRRYSASAIWESTWHRGRDFWRFFIGPFLTPALLFAGFVIGKRRWRPWVWLSAFFMVEHATYHAWYPQQSASETILIVLLVTEGWRSLRERLPRRQVGLAMSRNLAAGFVFATALLCVGLAAVPRAPRAFQKIARVWDTMGNQDDPRAAAIRRLANIPGKHLVFMRYGPTHRWYDEWVFNGADIPGSRIVFARMCDPESDMALAHAMSERDVWIADPDNPPLLARVDRSQLLAASRANVVPLRSPRMRGEAAVQSF